MLLAGLVLLVGDVLTLTIIAHSHHRHNALLLSLNTHLYKSWPGSRPSATSRGCYGPRRNGATVVSARRRQRTVTGLREASRARNASRPTHMFVHVYVCVCVCAHSAGEVVDEAASTEDEVVAKVMSTAEEVGAETVSMVDEVVAESASTMDKVAAEAASTVDEVVATASNAHARSSSLPHRRVAGKFYRAEKDLLLQGILAPAAGTASVRVELGPCPVADYKSAARCPAHDPNCGCHGPVMTRGMVGWAGGGGGPDFFINTFVSAASLKFCVNSTHESRPTRSSSSISLFSRPSRSTGGSVSTRYGGKFGTRRPSRWLKARTDCRRTTKG